MAEDYAGTLNLGDPTNATLAQDIDNKIVVVKTAVKQSFPNVTGAVTKTHTELNALPDPGDAETISGNWEFSGTPTFGGRNFKGMLSAAVDNSGAITSQSDPGTLSVTKTATGTYTVTHNLGTTNYTAIAIVTATDATYCRSTYIAAKATNSFQVNTYFVDTTSVTHGNYAFEVIVIPH